jgi:AbiV family abortive infection protein
MGKQIIFPVEYVKSMTWEEAFAMAKFAWNNAERLHYAAIVLHEKGYTEQAYNNLFIACEEYFKAKSFDGIAYVKMKGEPVKEEALKEFCEKSGDHKWKFREAFFDAEMNIPNITLKVEDGIDDTEIQENLHKEMQETFDFLNTLNPYDKKNNSLYIGYCKDRGAAIVPQQEISKEIVERFFKICFYIQMTYRVDQDNPSGEFSNYLKWSGKEFKDFIVNKKDE